MNGRPAPPTAANLKFSHRVAAEVERKIALGAFYPGRLLPGLTARAARHTYATTALMGGVRPGYVAAQMGHSSTRMFFETYARWMQDADKGVQRQAMVEAFTSDSAGGVVAKAVGVANAN